MVPLLIIGGLALAGYGFSRWRNARNEKPHIQRILY